MKILFFGDIFGRSGREALINKLDYFKKKLNPDFILANGEPLKYSGINSIGLRRRDFDLETRNLIKKAYKILYLSHFNRSQAIDEIKNTLELTDEIKLIIEFIENSDRGLI